MAYPSFPVAANSPAWLTSFDPSFMPDAFTTGILGSGAAFPIVTNAQNQRAFFNAWNGGGGKIQPQWFPQRIGLRYAWLLGNGASVGGGT